jgi:hypothetical protein
MKKIMIGLMAGIMLLSIVAFKVANYEPKKATADVESYQGVYIFIHSKPVMEYDYKGTCKLAVTWSAKASEAINAMTKKVKKDFPDADGIIFTDENLWQADAVKFKQ